MSWGRAMAVVSRTTLVRASRRASTYVIAGLGLLPPALAALMGALGEDATRVAAPLAIRLIAPLVVVALVASAVGESYENRTAVYWFVRPVSRASVVAGEWLGWAMLVAGVMGLSGAFLAIANAITGNPDALSLARIPLAFALEAVVLVGLATGIAALVPKHPLVTAIGFLTLTEGALALLPGAFQYASLSYHIGQLAGVVSATEDAPAAPAAVGAVVSAVVLALYGLLPLAIAMKTAEDRDLG